MKDFRDVFVDIYKCKVYGIVSYIYKLTWGTQTICSKAVIKT